MSETELEELSRDILLALDNPGTYCSTGSWGCEITICGGCKASADEWHSQKRIKHADGCLTVAGNEAEARLRKLAKEKQ